MNQYFESYSDAKKYAQGKANLYRASYGIEKSGRGFIVRCIPTNPKYRFGFDYTCEAVEPEGG